MSCTLFKLAPHVRSKGIQGHIGKAQGAFAQVTNQTSVNQKEPDPEPKAKKLRRRTAGIQVLCPIREAAALAKTRCAGRGSRWPSRERGDCCRSLGAGCGCAGSSLGLMSLDTRCQCCLSLCEIWLQDSHHTMGGPNPSKGFCQYVCLFVCSFPGQVVGLVKHMLLRPTGKPSMRRYEGNT